MISFLPSREVLVAIGDVSIHWYGTLYIAAFLLAWLLLPRLGPLRNIYFVSQDWEELLAATVIGVIVGGRLGFVLFYEPAYFLANPLDIVAVWKGGMASHGGFIGVALALLWVLRHRYTLLWQIVDVITVPVALGLALGRVGNLINQELYGTLTTLPWGMEFDGIEGLRHPTQIYAIIKNLTLATVCYLLLKCQNLRPGMVMATFLMLYPIFRFIVEFFRFQEHALVSIGDIMLTRGQALSIPVFLIGVAVFLWLYRTPSSAKS